jgi:hypothetical protein
MAIHQQQHPAAREEGTRRPSSLSIKCRRKFLRFFPKGFYDEKYLAWERDYKWKAHTDWESALSKSKFKKLLQDGEHSLVAATAVRIESRTNLLFSFEKMALRDALREAKGAKLFSEGLFNYLYGRGQIERRFEEFRDVISELPRKQTRVLTWPLLTVFPFIAQPATHIFLKPQVTKSASEAYGYELDYDSKPTWRTYQSLLDFSRVIEREIKDLRPRDLIDIQSFIWVQGSSEYDE